MNRLPDWSIALLVLAAIALFVQLLRRAVASQSAFVERTLDACDYVVIEALPVQLPAIQNAFDPCGWRLGEAKPAVGEAMHYRFDKVDELSSPLSEVLLPGKQRSKRLIVDVTSDFQMKVKAHGLRRDLYA